MQRTAPASPADKLVVVHPERRAQRSLQRMLGATLCPVEVAPDLAAAAIDDHTIVVVDAALAVAALEACKRAARAWIAVPGEGTQPADPTTVSALLHAGWNHVVAHPMPLLAEELLATAQKLIRRDCFGLDKYMAWGAEVRSYTLEDALERDLAVAAIASDVTRVGLPDRIGSLVSVIADELLANALYAAPVDDAGAKHRVHDPRDRSRLLADRDVVSLRWSTDGRYLAIEVRDRWGTIEPASIEARLAATKTSTVESGMGLPLAYACSNQLVVNVAPQAMTEVIALLDIRYKPTELARSASFHAFWGEPP
ncbi:MAG: hypothetical protein ABJE66_27645 [Deltaproteobacteria bacterium]